MSVKKYLESQPLADLTVYRFSLNYQGVSIKFTGSPRKHPYDREKIILMEIPFSGDSIFYEFRVSDIAFMEDLPSLGTVSGETTPMVNLWIRKGSFGVRFQAFEVNSSDDAG